MVDQWTTHVTDEEVLQYIDDCGASNPLDAHVTISFTNIDEALSLLAFVARSLQHQKAEFLTEIQHSHSSSAHSCAQTFNVLLNLQRNILTIVKDYAVGRWSEKAIAELPSYPGNVR